MGGKRGLHSFTYGNPLFITVSPMLPHVLPWLPLHLPQSPQVLSLVNCGNPLFKPMGGLPVVRLWRDTPTEI